jgi:tetratricopeptide (TPR) repeat protein
LAAHTRALRGAANLAFLVSDYVRARRWHTEALALLRASADLQGVASTLGSLGSIAHGLGDGIEALSLLNEAYQLFKELGEPWGLAQTLGNLAEVYRASGDLEAALSRHLESVGLLRHLGMIDSLAQELINLGRTQCRRGDFARARRALDEAQDLNVQIQNRANLAESLEVYAEMAVREGRMELAAILIGKWETMHSQLGFEPKSVNYPAFADDCVQARAVLGDIAYAAARERGSNITDDEVIVLARET